MESDSHNGAPLPEQLAGIWQRRKWLLVTAFVLVFATAVSLVMALPSLYRASTTLLLGQGDISAALVKTASEDTAARLDVINKAVLSRSRLQELIERYNLYPELRQQGLQESVIDRMRHDVVIGREAASLQGDQSPTVTLTLSYQNRDPALAATIANELAFLFGQENENQLQHRNARTTEFLLSQLDQVGRQLATQESLISAFRNKHLGELPEQQNLNLTTLERLNADSRQNGEKQIQLMNRRDALLADSNALGLLSGQSGMSRLDVLRAQLSDLGKQYTDRYPEIARLKSEIHELETAPAHKDDTSGIPRGPALEAVTHELAELADQQMTLRTSIRELQGRIESTPGVAQELLELSHDYDTIREQHLSLQKRYQEARLSESMEQQNRRFQVLEPAIAPKSPVAPHRLRLIVTALVLSLGFSGGIAFLAEQFDTSFHTMRELRSFTSLPVLGSIARIETLGTRVQRGFRMLTYAIGMTAGIALLVVVAHALGKQSEPLVWLLANRGL